MLDTLERDAVLEILEIFENVEKHLRNTGRTISIGEILEALEI